MTPAQARHGCCDGWPKPCAYHEGWQDGWDQALQAVNRPDRREKQK